jgi:hypothetical protein
MCIDIYIYVYIDMYVCNEMYQSSTFRGLPSPRHLDFRRSEATEPAPRNGLFPWKTMRKPGETTGKPRENLPETIGKHRKTSHLLFKSGKTHGFHRMFLA